MRTFTRKINRSAGVAGDKVRAVDVNELQQAIEDFQTGDLTIPVSAVEGIPEDVSQVANMRVGIYNARDYSDLVVAGDWTAAIQAAVNAAEAAIDSETIAGAVIDLPNEFTVSPTATFTLSSVQVCVYITRSNIRLRGLGRGSVVRCTEEGDNGTIIFLFTGQGKSADSFAVADMLEKDLNIGNANFTVYEIDSVAAGDPSITLVTPSDTSHFAVGDAVYIRSGQTLSTSGEAQPDAELNIITAIDTDTGVMSLERPTAKPYVQEYFATSSKNTATTTTPSDWPAQFGVVPAEDVVIRNGAVENLHFETVGIAVATTQIIGFEFDGVTGDLNEGTIQGWGPHRGMTMDRMDVTMTHDSGTWTFFELDRGCGDFVAHGRFRETNAFGLLHINEGTYNVLLDALTLENPHSAAGGNSVVAGGGRGYNFKFLNSTVVSETATALVSIADFDGVVIDKNTLRRAAGDSSVSIQSSQNVSYGINDTGDGVVTLLTDATAGAYHVTPQVEEIWITHDSAAKEPIFNLPKYGFIKDIQIYVFIAFNGGSPTLQVGSFAFANVFMSAAVSLTSSGFKSITRATTSQWHDGSGGVVPVTAHYVADSSSAGRALVSVTWTHAPVYS